MRGKLLRFGLPAGLALALDQATKAWVMESFRLYESRPVIEGVFHLTYIRNPGAAFGLLAGHAAAFRTPFFAGVTLLALLGIGVAVRRLAPGRGWTLAALGLVAGGALGNLIDRLRWGEVVDFLDFFWRGHHWPAFNLADSAITVGVAMLLLEEFRGSRRPAA